MFLVGFGWFSGEVPGDVGMVKRVFWVALGAEDGCICFVQWHKSGLF